MRNLTFFLFVGLFVFFCNCKKETSAKVQTIVERDTVYVAVHDTTTVSTLISDTTTTFIIMRHAEKETTGTDPNLNSDGLLRAEELKRILGSTLVHAIYSTPYNRTRQTVQPLATAKAITITEYPTSKPYAQLVDEIRSANRGKAVVIVGHSNTVPDLLKTISNNSFNVTINDSQYDNLFIVTLPAGQSATIMPLKYGKETP
ncbi:MAG: phosphoglycerate mutase [Flavipsychrobacter sp.]|nr:phosphoglycerate mutase [Flavipsychrobacter sp.]